MMLNTAKIYSSEKMPDENEYEKLVTWIEEIEQASKKEEVSFIDISEMFEKPEYKNKKSYQEMLDMISDTESGGKRYREKEPPQPAQPQIMIPNPIQNIKIKMPKKKQQTAQQQQTIQQQEGAASHLITSGVAQTQFTQTNVVKKKTEKKGFFNQAPSVSQLTEQKQNVANELSKIASSLSSSIPDIKEFTRRKINTKELVLPNLSAADQISELERIIEGLKEQVFDQAHVNVVSQEVYGLKQVVNDSKKKKKVVGVLEASLLELRDQRLDEAIALLEQQTGAS